RASVACDWYTGPLDVLVRFFPAEWLPRLPAATGWQRFFASGQTPVCNPGHAVLSQSKRFPLVWDRLTIPLPAWRSLVPETRSPGEVGEKRAGAWVRKPALGHEGKDIGIDGVTDADAWQRIRRAAAKEPGAWIAQRRFEVLPLSTPDGLLYPCLGVYVID